MSSKKIAHEVSKVLPKDFGVRVDESDEFDGYQVTVGITIQASRFISKGTIETIDDPYDKYLERIGVHIRELIGSRLRELLREYYGV